MEAGEPDSAGAGFPEEGGETLAIGLGESSSIPHAFFDLHVVVVRLQEDAVLAGSTNHN